LKSRRGKLPSLDRAIKTKLIKDGYTSRESGDLCPNGENGSLSVTGGALKKLSRERKVQREELYRGRSGVDTDIAGSPVNRESMWEIGSKARGREGGNLNKNRVCKEDRSRMLLGERRLYYGRGSTMPQEIQARLGGGLVPSLGGGFSQKPENPKKMTLNSRYWEVCRVSKKKPTAAQKARDYGGEPKGF